MSPQEFQSAIGSVIIRLREIKGELPKIETGTAVEAKLERLLELRAKAKLEMIKFSNKISFEPRRPQAAAATNIISPILDPQELREAIDKVVDKLLEKWTAAAAASPGLARLIAETKLIAVEFFNLTSFERNPTQSLPRNPEIRHHRP
jgi:hypothetical protein